jgi:hypothetical protein
MNMDDYPYYSLSEDESLCSTGQHRPGFSRVLWDTLHHGYDRTIPLYRCRPFQAHGLNVCEVRVEIHFDPMVPWTGSVVSSEIDDTVEKMGMWPSLRCVSSASPPPSTC